MDDVIPSTDYLQFWWSGSFKINHQAIFRVNKEKEQSINFVSPILYFVCSYHQYSD